MLVAVGLEDAVLWDRFNRVQNEMIITRNGRCLFPLLKLTFSPVGNEMAALTCDEPVLRIIPGHRYGVGVSIVEADSMRWRYRADQWQPVLSAENRNQHQHQYEYGSESTRSSGSSPIFRLSGPSARRIHVYEPISYVTPEEMIHHGLSFGRIKLSNRPQSEEDRSSPNFALLSFRRYIPVVYLLDRDMRGDPRPISQVLAEEPNPPAIIKFSFPATNFIAVTHYQNELVTTLKKSFNPHAKGFLIRSPKRYIEEDDETSEDSGGFDQMSSQMSQDELIATQTLASMSLSPIRHLF